MTTGHTPGPWESAGSAVYQSDLWKDGKNLGGKHLFQLPEESEPDGEAFANARLAASAPELLASLIELLSESTASVAAQERAGAAITKALAGAVN